MRVLHAVQQFIGTRTTAWAGPGLLWTAGSCAYGLSCLIASDGVGPLGWHAARVLLLLSLSVFTVLELSGGEGLFHARRILLILGYAAAARAPFDVLAVAPALAALGMARSDRDPVVVWRLAGLAAFLFVAKAYLVLPVGWYVGERVASLISGQVSALAPWRVQMGPSMLGLPGLAFYACSLLVAVPLLWRAAGGRRSLLAGAALLAMLFGGQVVARVAVPAFSLHRLGGQPDGLHRDGDLPLAAVQNPQNRRTPNARCSAAVERMGGRVRHPRSCLRPATPGRCRGHGADPQGRCDFVGPA